MKEKWLKYFCNVAEQTAELSTARRLKVGAVIVKDNRILSIGYNGTPAGWDNNCEDVVVTEYDQVLKTKPEVLHAEANALMKLCKSTESSEDATLFITHTPCIECAKLIHQSGVKNVYCINEYKARKGDGAPFLKKAGVELIYV